MPTLHDYRQSLEVSARGYSFYALLFALIRDADSANLKLIHHAFPDVYDEFCRCFYAPGGAL